MGQFNPKHEVEPYKLARDARLYRGHISIQHLPRLAESVAKPVGEVSFTAAFGFDENKRVLISGEYETTVTLNCQRCLEDFKSTIKGTFDLTPVFNDSEAKQLQAEHDTILLNDEGKLVFGDMLEDEIILSLPFFPKHEKEDCNFNKNQAYYSAENEFTEELPKRDNPFKDLASMIEQANEKEKGAL